MIVEIYKKVNTGKQCEYVLLTIKNIECVPQKGTFILFSGQLFIIERMCFDADNCKYYIYTKRINMKV